MTDHSKDIATLRDMAALPLPLSTLASIRLTSLALGTAAALLEVHDATGLSLDEWQPVREFVETLMGHPLDENHV